MTDTYLCSDNLESLMSFCAGFLDVIGPAPGRAAIEESVDDSGLTVPAQPACGDPDKFYACIRSEVAIELHAGIEAADPSEAIPLVGVWA